MALAPIRSTVEWTLLDAAHILARRATMLEQSPTPSKEDRRESRAAALGAILTSVAFLEAVISGIWDGLRRLDGLPKEWFAHRQNLARIAELGMPDDLKLPLLARYELTLAMADARPLD